MDTLARRASATLFLAGVAAGCQWIGGYEDFEQQPPHPCDTLPPEKFDDTELAQLVLAKQSDGSCYWVDRTEVTVEQYSAFLDATKDNPVEWDHRCEWKTEPSDPEAERDHDCSKDADTRESDPFRSSKPIRCVDWCDARAFCRWANKDLCVGQGNALGVEEPTDARDEWGNACSLDALPLPYGDGVTPESGACNVRTYDGKCSSTPQAFCVATDVGSRDCTGPFGAVDMIGNVREWVVACGNLEQAPQGQMCQFRGGSFDGVLKEETCYTPLESKRRDTRVRDLGFRCCDDLTPMEASRVR